MNCEIIAVGTELLLGNTVNTNAAQLSERLAMLGINVFHHTVVGDNPARLLEVVKTARSRADLIITTGGLGPTYDDLTKNILASAFGKALVLHPEEERFLRDYYAGRGHPFTDNVLQQAYLPEDCTVFHNDWGTAPGCAFESGGVHVLLLPGPPRECLPMFDFCAAPYLRALSGTTLVSRQIHVFGMGESAVEAIFRESMERMTNPTLATYAKEGEVMLRVTAAATDEKTAAAMCEPVVESVADTLGDCVYSVEEDSLEARVLTLLRRNHQTFAAAESLTGGLIGARFTALAGASEVFLGGAVTYCDDVKADVLGIDRAILCEKGAVSRETAAAMAESVRRMTGADFGVSATGLAGPDGDGVHPVGTVYIGLAAADGTWVRPLTLHGDRSRIRTLSANHAFDLLRRKLTGLPLLREHDKSR